MQKKQIVILIGPPGSGKDTQAQLLADDFGFYHLKTSEIIEQKLKYSSEDDPVLGPRVQEYKAGKLVNPEYVALLVIDKIKEVGTTRSIVFSGSFRTLYEAEHEIPVVEELFGRENIHVVNIEVSEEESMKRNSKRRICKANRHPIPNFPEYENITTCPKDGSEIITRILDNLDTIKIRYQTYLEDTKPALELFKEHDYDIIPINGAQSIRDVHKDILNAIDVYEHEEFKK